MLGDFEGEHMSVFEEAMDIYVDRSKKRGQMWLYTPVEREFIMIEEKMARARSAWDRMHDPNKQDAKDLFVKEFEDSLLDLINFANFAIKKERRAR